MPLPLDLSETPGPHCQPGDLQGFSGQEIPGHRSQRVGRTGAVINSLSYHFAGDGRSPRALPIFAA